MNYNPWVPPNPSNPLRVSPSVWQHLALSSKFEKVLHSINKAVSLPYW